MGKSTELMQLLKTGNSDAARKLIAKLRKSGKKKLLAKELNFPDETGQGQTVMHYCAAQNFIEFLGDLADLGASIDAIDDRGFTPLHLAASHGRTSAVTSLLKRGADPNISAHAGDTALHFACQNGHVQSVEALVAQHGNCTMLNVSGQTPLDAACQNGHPQVVSVLLKSGQFSQSYLQRSGMPHTALILAAKSGHNDIIALLINHGFDINRKLQGYSGNCLHEAVLYGKVETVRYLLQCGADIRCTNNQGLSPLEIVQMYTDPRSAGQMKQVLQDALAQEARVRISHQHQQQQQFPQGGGAPQQQQYYQQQQGHAQQPHPLTQQPHPLTQQQQQYPRQQQQSPYQQVGAHQQGYAGAPQPSPTGPQPSPSRVDAKKHGQPAFSYLGAMGGQSPVKKRSESTSSQGSGGYQQPYQQQPQQQQQQQQQQTYQQQQAAYQQQQAAYQQQQHAYQQQQQQQQQQQTPQYAIPQPRGLSMQEQIEQKAASRLQNRTQSIDQTLQSQEAARRATVTTSANPSDLASMVAARAASRKPMASSPTRKDFPREDALERLGRSSTMDRNLDGARHNALKRRNSLTEQSISEPAEYYDQNPPTLPRRSNIGPPSFKPPPPSEGPPGSRPQHQASAFQQTSTPSPEHTAVPRLRKVVPKPPPQEPSADNELLKKLQRRQHRIEEGGGAPEGSSQPEGEEAKPPPPPERSTSQQPLQQAPPPPATQPPPSGAPPPPVQHQPPPPASHTPKSGAPPPAPKAKPKPKPKKPVVEEEPLPPGVQPWQAEVIRRKREAELQQRMEEERIAEEERIKREAEENARAEAERIRQEEERVAEEQRQREEAERQRAEAQRKAEEEKQRKAEARRKAAEQRKKAEEERLKQEEETRKAMERRLKMNERKQRILETGVDEEAEEEKRKEEERAQREEEERKKEEERAREEEQRKKEEEERLQEEARLAAEEKAKEEELAMKMRELERAKAEEEQRLAEQQRLLEEQRIAEQQARELAEAQAQHAAPEEPVHVIAPPEEFSVQAIEQKQAPPIHEQKQAPPIHEQTPPIERKPEELKLKDLGHHFPAGSTPTSEMSRSTSLSSLNTAGTGHGSPAHHVTEPVPVGDWLSGYKLSDYVSLFEEAGYDTTDFLQGLTSDQLVDIGVAKPGHKKKILTALSSIRHKEHLLMSKPASVEVWLKLIGLSQYEQALIDAGYDDIDFVSDISSEELEEIGVTKKGHLRRFMRGIGELVDVSNAAPTTPSVSTPPTSHFNGMGGASSETPDSQQLPDDDTSKTPEPRVATPPSKSAPAVKEKPSAPTQPADVPATKPHPPEKTAVDSQNSPANFARMRSKLAFQMGLSTEGPDEDEVSNGNSDRAASHSPSHSPSVQRRAPPTKAPVPPPPKRGTSNVNRHSLSSSTSSLSSNQSERVPASGSHDQRASMEVPLATQQRIAVAGGRDEQDGLDPVKKSFSVEDITAALDEMVEEDEYLNKKESREGQSAVVETKAAAPPPKATPPVVADEMDALSRALQGFPGKEGEGDEEPDELLASIDDMLADLNTELDILIPAADGVYGTDV